ncbi:uncharacterized protein SPSK_05843 [Sporothrix schenckii 1099-18]|uniref:Uncharacterized protein n=1 Tax=Sporothrix schenckii 1099-18 TaxID=1397361 RepID=A0A0F2MK09_SPOSC|nr:uncharacterized protein SPSK_05843 [Sporothrix schenckii 1099-18]KJR89937.1 hypothetical protein SPSK_05843 [Sporothrix schenckii 1099-18]
MPTLLARNGAGTAGATSGGPAISLGVIIAIVIIGTVFVAVASGLLCTWAARRKRHKRRESRRMEEEEARKKQMMTVTMMRDSDEEGRPADGQPVAGDAAATAAAAAAANYFRPGGANVSDCASSTCCSLASTRDSFSTMDGDFEGAGLVWWWMWRWRRFWHNQRRWVRRQRQRVPAVLGRTGSNSSGGSQGGSNEIKLQSQRNHCLHNHGHHGHHHHRRGTADGSPRKLRRRRPETSIIASTNSLFFPSFAGENDNNGNSIARNAASGEIGLREPPPTFSVIRANSFPQRPPPPSEQQRLLAPSNQPPSNMSGHNGPWFANNVSGSGSPSRSSMANMPPRPQNPRYRPQQPPNPTQQRQQQHQQGPSLQPPPPISTRTLPRPPQPALIIPRQPETYIPPGVPFHPSMPAQQQHQMMVMMMQQQQVQLQQQIRQQHMLQQQQNRLSRSGSKHASQPNYATEAALTEILRSTEQRLGQLQGQQQLGNLGSLKRASTTGPAKTTDAAAATATATAMSTAAADADNESIKRVSQTSGSDADSMVAARKNSRDGEHGKDARDSSPILDAIPTALSSPSKSPNKNRVAAGTLTQAAGGSSVMAHPMMLPAPAVHLPAPTPSNLSNSSPETRSPSSAYSSAASSRSSLSTVYSVDERSDKGTVASRATSKGGVRIANSGDDGGDDDDAQNDRILAGLGITLTADSQLFAAEKDLERVQVSHAVVPGTDDATLVPAALSTPKSRASRGMSVIAAAAPDLPPRSPKRSAGTIKKANGIMIPHSSSGNNLGSMMSTSANTNSRNGANQGRSRHRRNGSVWQQAPSPQHQQSGYNMMHSNSLRFTFGGPHNMNGANSDNDDGPATPSQVVRRMATSPSKRGANNGTSTSSNNSNASAADPSDEKTPSSAVSIIPPSSPTAWRKSADRSLLQSSPTLAPEDEHSLVPHHANPRTSWGNGGPPPNPPRHRRRSLNERIEALQAIESEEAQFRRAVRPLPRPPSFGSLSNLTALNALSQQMAQNPHGSYSLQTSKGSQKNDNSSSSNNNNTNNNMTVISAAAELRRMNSTAYSEASSCYSNATSAIGRSPALGSVPSSAVHIATTASAMGLTQPRRAARRRNSSAGESASGMANRSSAVGSRQYLALGKKRLSQVPSHGGGGYDKENRGAVSKRSSAPPAASSSSSSSSGTGGVSSRPPPQRTRSARSMTTTGTVLRRVDENPASGSTTPSSGTPNKTGGALTPSATAGSHLGVVANANANVNANANPSTPKANTGRPLRKSPSRSTQVGTAALPAHGSPVSKLRARSTMGPSTPPSVRSMRQQAAASRDSLGLYDQDGFLLSSPARKV